jgi:predicted nucleic acid-binding protein
VFVVDTNLLVYAANEDFPRQRELRKLLAEWSSSPETWYVTWSIVYEVLSVSTHRSAFAHPLSFSQAWHFIDLLRVFWVFQDPAGD